MSDKGLVAEFGIEVPAGTAVFRQGDNGGSIYIIRSGRARVIKQAHGSRRVITSLGPGDFFGEMAVISGKPRSATVEITEDATLLKIPSHNFEKLLMREGEVAVRLLQRLIDRLDTANRLIDVLIESDDAARVILEITRVLEETGPETIFNAEQIALRLGLDEVTVTCAIKRLLRVGVLDDQGHVIRVRNRDRLEQFLSFLRIQGAA